jgi:hypothetical protein
MMFIDPEPVLSEPAYMSGQAEAEIEEQQRLVIDSSSLFTC